MVFDSRRLDENRENAAKCNGNHGREKTNELPRLKKVHAGSQRREVANPNQRDRAQPKAAAFRFFGVAACIACWLLLDVVCCTCFAHWAKAD